MTAQNLQGTDVTGVPSRWSVINPTDTAAAATLEDIKASLDPIFTALSTLAELIKGVLELTVNLLTDFADPVKAAVLAALDAVRTILDDLVGQAGCYFIGIPIIPIDRELSDAVLYPKSPDASLVERLEPISVAVKKGRVGSGGNYGFLSKVSESLDDRDDPFKPTFDEDAHVAGLVVYIGAESYLKVASLINRLVTLFSGPDSKGSGIADAMKSGSDFPRPKNLTAELGPSAETSAMLERLKNRYSNEEQPSAYAVRLSWDLEDEVHVLPWPSESTTGRETWKILNVRIYRDLKPIPTVIGWKQLDRLKIAEYEFNGWVSEFFDDGVPLGRTYFYAVGYEMAEVLDEGNGEMSEVLSSEPQPFNVSTTQITIPEEIDIFTRKGVPPDWSVIPSPLSMVPAITNIVRRIHAVLDSFEKGFEDKAAKMEKYIKDLEKLILKYINWVQEIVDTVEAIIDSLSWPDVYAGATGFAGKGGNAFMLNSLGKALFDESDPTRPQFDNGTEAVCGFILYAGSTTVGGVQKFISQCEFLFGVNFQKFTDMATGAAEDYTSAWDKAVETIDVATDEVERQICLSDNLSHLIDCPVEEEYADIKFGTDLETTQTDEDIGCEEG